MRKKLYTSTTRTVINCPKFFASTEAAAIAVESTDSTLDPVRAVARALLSTGDTATSRRIVKKIALLATHCTSSFVFDNALRVMAGVDVTRGVDESRSFGVSKQLISKETSDSLENLRKFDPELATSLAEALRNTSVAHHKTRPLLSSGELMELTENHQNVFLVFDDERWRARKVFAHIDTITNAIELKEKESNKKWTFRIRDCAVSACGGQRSISIHVSESKKLK